MSPPPYPCFSVPPDGNCPQTPTYPARECTSGASFWGSWYTGKPWPIGWGDAMNWPTRARMAGYTVNTICTENSIMCLPPNHNGAGPKGHVAYVVGPIVQGHAEVWEMNFLIPHGFDYRPALVTGCEYIHLVPKPVPPAPDPPFVGDAQMWLFQASNGTIYLVNGWSPIALSFSADVTYLESKGVPLVLSSKLTPSGASEIAAKLGL